MFILDSLYLLALESVFIHTVRPKSIRWLRGDQFLASVDELGSSLVSSSH